MEKENFNLRLPSCAEVFTMQSRFLSHEMES